VQLAGPFQLLRHLRPLKPFYMRIGIDARMMGYGFGIARYELELVKQLMEIDTDNTYVLFLRRENWDLLDLPANFSRVLADISWYSFEEQWRMPRIIRAAGVDLMHFPHWNVPLAYRSPFVLTIHDLIMYHFPRPQATTLGPFKFWMKDRIHRIVLKWAAHRARHILATSMFTKFDIMEHLGISDEHITVTYQAPFGRVSDDVVVQSALLKWGISTPYVLYVGSAYPHKNLETLLDAWQLIEREDEHDLTLVLVGAESPFYERLTALPSFSRLSRAVYTGFVTDAALEDLYTEASLLVHPSLYEGFGLTPLEALIRGIPVVAAAASCLPEVLGGAALYVDPTSPADIAAAIIRLSHDEAARLEILGAARTELARYSWRDLAEKTVRAYQHAVNG